MSEEMEALVGPAMASSSTGTNNMVSGFSRMCRACASCTDLLVPIFHGEGLLNNLPEKIQKHLPIKVSEWDRLPQQLCRPCADTLLAWHELVKCCSQADAALRTRLQRLQELHPQNHLPTTSDAAIETVDDKNNVKFKVPPLPHAARAPSSPRASSRAAPRMSRRADSAALHAANTCYYCRARFPSADLFRDHMASVHAGVLFHCDECGRYEDRRNLSVHMSRHAADYAAKVNRAGSAATGAPPPPPPPPPPPTPPTPPPASAPERVAQLKLINNVPDPVRSDHTFNCSEMSIVSNIKIENRVSSSISSEPVLKTESGACGDDRAAFSDSDSSDGFGELPDSVFRAIEDPKEAPEESGGRRGARSDKNKKTKVCPTCAKVFTVSSSYFYHVKHVHGQVRPHACAVCARRFASRAARDDHATLHTGARDHRCPTVGCGKLFRSRAGLYIHTKDVHSAAEAKAFACGDCGKRFRWRQKLELHARRHRRERAHVCERCGRGFSARSDLLRHADTHSGRKPYGCDACGQHFNQRRYLKNHIAARHPATTIPPTPKLC